MRREALESRSDEIQARQHNDLQNVETDKMATTSAAQVEWTPAGISWSIASCIGGSRSSQLEKTA